VVPRRVAEYDLNGLAGGQIPVRVRGFSHRQTQGASRTSVMVARLEEREHGDSASDEPVGWRPIDTVVLDAIPGNDFEVRWEGTLTVPATPATPLRVSILEAQVLEADAGALQAVGTAPLTAHVAELQRSAETSLGFRIVYADATVVLP
jgi:hypothetical protein